MIRKSPSRKFGRRRFKDALRKLAMVLTCLGLITHGGLISGTRFVAAQQKPATKKSKKAKRAKPQPRLQLVGTFTIPQVKQQPAEPPVNSVRREPSSAPAAAKQTLSVARQQDMSANAQLESRRVGPAQISKVNLLSLGFSKSKRVKGRSITQSEVLHEMPLPGSIRELDVPRPAPSAMSQAPADSGGPLVPSPASSTNFQGEFDQAKGGGPSGVFTTPPDTMGAVGLDKVVSYLNNNIVVHDKVSGAVLSLASIESFWASTGAIQVFDTRIQYDPYNNRWLIAAVSNAQNSNSSVLVGLSHSPDPQGTFSLYRFNVGCAAGSPGCSAQGEWADFPMLGFNKNWVTVAWNQFTISGGSFLDGQLLVLDYPSLRGGVASSTLFSGVSAANAGFCMHPAATYSATENTLYLPSHQSSSGAAYRLHTITGTSDAPVFTVGALQTRPGGAWVQPGGDILPQHCVPAVGGAMQTCPATIRRIDTADAFIRSNVVFRNGKIYYPQTIGLPLSGLTHTAAQWTVLNPDGTFFDGGRVEDPTATNSNGGKWFAYPSLSVNKNNDILFGFSEFESDDYADAGYTFRLGGDPPGTMRDPVIYKEGEDYYEKTFGGTRNRWGDYSHSVVDPVNDRDLWTVQEYAMLRQGTTGLGSNDSRWGTWWAKITAPAGPGDLLISEFRLRGPNGSTDEFVEILNPNSTPLIVQTVDGSAGYSLVVSDGVSRFTIPNGTVIPARGHYLGVNSASYSLSAYPAGAGTSATGDATYATDIPDNAGIALFNTSTAVNFTLGNRLDAAGSTNEANTLYREGAGYPALAITNLNYSFVRTFCPNNFGIFGTALGCTPNGGAAAKDSNDNAADFLFIDTNFMSVGAGQRLGAPGPENLSGPIERTTLFALQSLDVTVSASGAPNRVRDLTSDPANNSTFGTLALRRRVVNGTGGPVTRLRFRVVDMTSVPAPSGFADLRARTSALVSVSGINDSMTCSPSPTPCTVNVQGTTMEEPPSQVNGGGFNTSLSAGTITLATPLAAGASINLQFLFGVQQTGSFRVFVIVEALP